MAKGKMEMMGCECRCGPGGLFKMVLAAILMAVGLYFGLMGLMWQWSGSADWLPIMALYALGLFGLHLGKVMKKMAACPMHGGMCCK